MGPVALFSCVRGQWCLCLLPGGTANTEWWLGLWEIPKLFLFTDEVILARSCSFTEKCLKFVSLKEGKLHMNYCKALIVNWERRGKSTWPRAQVSEWGHQPKEEIDVGCWICFTPDYALFVLILSPQPHSPSCLPPSLFPSSLDSLLLETFLHISWNEVKHCLVNQCVTGRFLNVPERVRSTLFPSVCIALSYSILEFTSFPTWLPPPFPS